MNGQVGWRIGVLAATCASVFGAIGFESVEERPHTDARLRKIKIVVETSQKGDAGTDANIYLAPTWRTADEANGTLFKLPTKKSQFKKGGTDTVTLTIPERSRLYNVSMGSLGAFVLVNGMNGDRPGWHVRAVHIFGYADDGHTYLLSDATANRWLDTKERTGPAVVIPLKVSPRDMGATDQIGDAPEMVEEIESWPAE